MPLLMYAVRLATLRKYRAPLHRRIPLFAVALAAFTVALSAPSALAAQATARIAGTVTVPGGAVVAAAAVSLRRGGVAAYTTQTDATGRYAFATVTPGGYTLVVSKEPLPRYAAPVSAVAAQDRIVDVVLGINTLTDVVVTASRSAQRLADVAAAVTVVDSSDIQSARRGINLEESLRRVPGVRVEDELGSSGRTRIIIRGTGTRANSPAGSGVRGVKILVDGIPKNNAGGSAQDLINIDLNSVQRIEVLRGPSSALYGNQSGGVVNLITEEGGPVTTASLQQTVGAYGLYREHAKVSGETGPLSYRISGFRTDLHGYRKQSRFDDTGLDSKFVFTVDDRTRITMLLAYDRSFQQSPGPLTAAQNAANREQASPTFATNDVHSYVDELRFAGIYNRQLFDRDEFQFSGYYIPRHLGPFVQIGVRIPQDFSNRGSNVRYVTGRPLGGMESRLTVGADFQDTPINTGTFNATTGAASAFTEENATTFGAYALEELVVLPSVRLSAGARNDRIRFASRDLTKPGTHASRTFTKTTPKAGITVQATPALSLYGSYSKGFETPVIGELRVIPGGSFGFNKALDPQTSTNYEIGARGDWLHRVNFEVALFKQLVKNQINPVGTFPNNSFRNVGKVDQKGLEVGSRAQIGRGLALAATYTYSDFTFRDYVANNVDFRGKNLPGVPRHTGFAELSYRGHGILAAFEGQRTGRFPFNNVNDAFNEAYTVANARLSYDAEFAGRHVAPFLGVNNLFDEKYSAFALINDAGRRFYNPLPGTNAYGGVRVDF